ncbi:MAG TPA: hypothetical protein PK349_02625 [Candidatus Hydrogenedentes bacterium]|nr:hypothetical protein [Candidatus Hydrogenedentota bacterium]HOV59940.1 hypothetical protein [Candidatus Hydrogenedentota bacterium]
MAETASASTEPRRARTLWEYLRDGFVAAHRRRPVSFYLLLTAPVALALGSVLGRVRHDVRLFSFTLIILFLFFGVLTIEGVRDFFRLLRKYLRDHRHAYRETVGDPQFQEQLYREFHRARSMTPAPAEPAPPKE